MQLSTRKKRKPIINITSLIDVLFLLLIFFMVSSTFLDEPGLKLALPKAGSAETGEKQEYTLYITAEGDIFLNSIPVPEDSLEYRLKAILPKMKDATLTLRADKEVRHGQVVYAMDKARLVGVKKLIVATQVETQ